MDIIKDKTILVTGGAGSIGSALVKELIKHQPRMVRVLDTHELSLYELEQSLNVETRKKVSLLLGDVRDRERVIMATRGVDVIYHAAAYKHVHLCEYNPFEAIKVNVVGTQNMIDAALRNNAERFVFVSSDKAVNPEGTLGASKLLGEKITTAANYYRGESKCVFSSVRFGNVTMSSGSVMPLFINQIKNNQPVTITSRGMTRFLMPMKQAVDLILRATEEMYGGEVFVFKMKSVNIEKLARTIVVKYSNSVDKKKKLNFHYLGSRPGEKMSEKLITEEESRRVVESRDMLIILPAMDPPYQKSSHSAMFRKKASKIDHRLYSSEKPLMSNKELQNLIEENKFLEDIVET